MKKIYLTSLSSLILLSSVVACDNTTTELSLPVNEVQAEATKTKRSTDKNVLTNVISKNKNRVTKSGSINGDGIYRDRKSVV